MARRRFVALFGARALASGDYYNQMALHSLVRAGVDFDVVISQTDGELEEDLRGCCRPKRYDVVMAFGNAMQGPTIACSKEFPAQRFALIDGSAEGSKNVVSYSSDPLHISFLCGLAAANLTTTEATGCVLWSDNWVARQWIEAFVLGAKAAKQSAKVYYSFAGSTEEAHAKASFQMRNGADVIMCHAGAADQGIIRAAGENGRRVIGFLNERSLDPDHVLFDVVRRMEPLVNDAVRRTASKRFRGGMLIAMGLKEGSFGLDLKNAHESLGRKEKSMIVRSKLRVERGEFDGVLRGLETASPGGIQV